MRTTFRLSRIVGVSVMVAALGVLGARTVGAAENPANDCLIGVLDEQGSTVTTITCTDGDSCDADGATNQTCTFSLQACVNLPGVSGCAQRPIKKAKVTPASAGITVTPSGDSSACGAFTDVVVKLKKRGRKAGKKKLTARAIADVKPFGKNKDADKVVLTCTPCPSESCVPPSTTSTTTTPGTSTTSTTIAAEPSCGDGAVNGTEACDPAAATTGCGAGETCMPPGAITECTCKTCTPVNPVDTMQFTTTNATASYCGDPGLLAPGASGTASGTVETDAQEMLNLGAGCLYIGGGGGGVPGGLIPDGSQSNFDLTQACTGGETIIAGQAGDSKTCSKGSGPGKACINKLDTWPTLQACTTDADCPMTGANGSVADGSCVDKPNCLFGPPLPIENGGLSTCVVNTIGEDASGSIMPATGDAQVTLPLRSHTFIRPINDTTPCPTCVNNLCVGGQRDGQACTTTSPGALTTIDCPPLATGGAYLPEFRVKLDKLTTGTSTKTNPDGLFCPAQRTFSAFGGQNQTFRPVGDPTNPPIKIVTITETGSPAGDLTDNQPHAARLGAVFCIPETGNGLIDGAADLAGPGAVSLPGTVQILP